MSLRTVPRAVNNVRQIKSTNDISDIPGSKPTIRIRKVEKPDFHNTSDIFGTKPTQLIQKEVNRPIFANSTADIEGAQAVHKRPSDRVVDPLNPTYQLPTYKAKPATPLKFMGDRIMDISDITGTKPKRPMKPSGRNFNDISDIEGCQTGSSSSKPTRRDPPRDFNDVSDIMSTGFQTKRITNGLQPKYVVNGMVIENEPGMMPKKLIRERRGRSDFHDPHDIQGANSRYKSQKFSNRRQIRNPVDIRDIPGAGADTVRNALRTKRVTNPNNPNYQSLCGSVLGTVTKPNTPDPHKSSFFATLDADGDGQVTFDELLNAADKNKDGKLTVAELHKFAKGKISDKKLTLLMRSVDADGNGVVSLSEGRNFNNSIASSAAPPASAQSNQQADEVDRLRAELEMLRKEARTLKTTVPQSQNQHTRSVPGTGGSSRGRVRTSTSAAAAKSVLARSRGSTSGSKPNRGESLRQRRERIATAKEIEDVRNLP
jgi:hypothetical protein